MKFYFCIFLCFFSIFVNAQDTYKIDPYSQKVNIDGVADDLIWGNLPYSSNFVLIKGEAKSKFITRFKMFSDKENLFVLIEAQGQNLIELQKPSLISSKNESSTSSDSFVLYLAPRAEIDDHYTISVDFNGNIKDVFIPTMAGHGFPYSPRVDENWDSKTKCAVKSTVDGTIYLELQIPVEPLALQKNLFSGFGFNLQRVVYYQDGKNKKREDSCWSHVNGELWNTQKFGLIKGPLFQEAENFTEEDLKNLDQMTNGMTALLKSLDIYYKAMNICNLYIPEGTEVDGDISNFDHIPIPQYTVKADGYFRFYNSLRYKPYKELGNLIIGLLYQGYQKTKDANGKNYLIWNNLMSEDGKIHGYGNGQKLWINGASEVNFNQSKNNFNLKDVMFRDSLGQGFLDLSEIKDTLDKNTQAQIIEMLKGTLAFLHQPYVLVEKGSVYYWRIDSFEPFAPKPFEGDLKSADWLYLGQDIILMFMALYQFDSEAAKPYIESFVKFSAFYMQGRIQISTEKGPHYPHNIYKLDHRMLSLSAFAKTNQLSQFEPLENWLKSELPKIYKDIPKVEYSENGATTNSWSTQAVLEIYRLLGLKAEYLKFWELSFDRAMKPSGLFYGHQILPMNFSSYPLYFDYAKKAFDVGILTENDCLMVFKKMFLIYGNPKLHRDNLKYALDLMPDDITRPKWGNTPYECYTEGVLPEGIYQNGSAQAFYTNFGGGQVSAFFKTGEEAARNNYYFRYYQYTAPFQYHSDRYSYGKAESYCLLKMSNEKLTEKISTEAEQSFSIEVETPQIPKGFPVFGHLDITDVLYLNKSAKSPTGFKIASVSCNGKEIPFREYQILEYNRLILSKEDRGKLVFGIWSLGPSQKMKIDIKIKKKIFKQYFVLEPK